MVNSNKLLLYFLFLFMQPTYAQEKIKTVIINKNMDEKTLDQNTYKVSRLKTFKSQVPQNATREDQFKMAELDSDVALMDDFSKDILFLDAKSYSKRELEEKYPNIKISKLLKLKELIGAK